MTRTTRTATAGNKLPAPPVAGLIPREKLGPRTPSGDPAIPPAGGRIPPSPLLFNRFTYCNEGRGFHLGSPGSPAQPRSPRVPAAGTNPALPAPSDGRSEEGEGGAREGRKKRRRWLWLSRAARDAAGVLVREEPTGGGRRRGAGGAARSSMEPSFSGI